MKTAKLEAIAFGFVLSGTMSLLVAGVSTLRAAGLVNGFIELWLSAWLASWAVAFPVVIVVAPIARRIVQAAFKPWRDRESRRIQAEG